MDAARDLVERGAVGRAMEDADQRGLRRRQFDRGQVGREGFLALPSLERKGAEAAFGLAPESLHPRRRRQALFPAVPILHSKWRDRHRREARDPHPLEERHRPAVDVLEPLDTGFLHDGHGRLPVVVARDVVEVGRAGLPEILPRHGHEELGIEFPLRRDVGVGGQVASQDRGARAKAPCGFEELEIETLVAVEIRGVQNVCCQMVGSGIGHGGLSGKRGGISRSNEPR